ncbi:tail fiber domain-containing protein [Escherichia coli]|nr:tail fiber domain-containing protein [Escherichia coli]
MSTPITLKYPEDWTGTLASNHIVGEEHTVPRTENKCYALDGGPFFTESLVITEKLTGKTLVRGVDYKPIFLYQDATLYAGKEICAAIAIINDDIEGTLVNDYRIIGGVYVSLIDALYQAIEELKLDDRPINWDDIKNKPELYPPEPHIHHVSAIYGTEHLCLAIYSLKAAILIGDAASDNRLWAAIDQLRKDMQAADKDLTDLHYAHANRTDNPHEVTKAQVGLGNVQNYPTANKAEAEAGTAPDRYMTAQTVGWAIAKLAGDLVDAHANRRDNPHSVTKAQVNLGNVDNFPTASDSEAKAGTANNRFMTPLRTVAAIEQFALIPLNAHKADYNNPHRVTKAQVGLGNVQDYPMASEEEARAGVAANRLMAPNTTKASIETFALVPLNAHIADKNNPHQVSKAQVGLGSVENYPTANQAEAQGGSATNRYMTPQSTNWAIQKLAGDLVNAHANRRDNPHAVTKAQVGLGNVQNYGIASDAHAQQDVNTVYSTPRNARLAATHIIDTRLFWGSYSGNKLVFVDGNGGTRLGKHVIITENGGGEITRFYWGNSAGGGSALYFNSNIDVPNAYIRSDERSKHDIRYLKDHPESLSERLREMARSGLARFRHNYDPDVEKIGVIAQRVQEQFPEMINVSDKGLLSLDTMVYSGVLLGGWYEHDQQLRALRAMVEEIAHHVKGTKGI